MFNKKSKPAVKIDVVQEVLGSRDTNLKDYIDHLLDLGRPIYKIQK
jgi:hypothetical protein